MFLGDPHALVDFMRALDDNQLNDDGQYVVIAVQDDTFQPDRQTKYFKKCTSVVSHASPALQLVLDARVF